MFQTTNQIISVLTRGTTSRQWGPNGASAGGTVSLAILNGGADFPRFGWGGWVWGYPTMVGLFHGKSTWKWMMTRGTPISGNLHLEQSILELCKPRIAALIIHISDAIFPPWLKCLNVSLRSLSCQLVWDHVCPFEQLLYEAVHVFMQRQQDRTDNSTKAVERSS